MQLVCNWSKERSNGEVLERGARLSATKKGEYPIIKLPSGKRVRRRINDDCTASLGVVGNVQQSKRQDWFS